MSHFCLKQGQGLPKGLGGTPTTQTVYDICRLQTADCRPQTADCRPQTADCRLQTADCRL